MTTLPIAQIRTDGGTQPRAVMSDETIAEYRADMLAGAVFPPITVFYDGSVYWLADGFHRILAAKEAGLSAIEADVKQGTRRDAVLYSVSANSTHGLRRKNADKRQAVMAMLDDPEWAKLSDREIARRCSVSQPFVSEMRKGQSDNVITDAEALSLAEALIEARLPRLIDAGKALIEVRDQRLYREEYPTFEAFCQGQHALVGVDPETSNQIVSMLIEMAEWG